MNELESLSSLGGLVIDLTSVNELATNISSFSSVGGVDPLKESIKMVLITNAPQIILIIWGLYLMATNLYNSLDFKVYKPNFDEYVPYIFGLIVIDIVMLSALANYPEGIKYVLVLSFVFYFFWIFRAVIIGWDARRHFCYFEI